MKFSLSLLKSTAIGRPVNKSKLDGALQNQYISELYVIYRLLNLLTENFFKESYISLISFKIAYNF